MTAAAEAPQSGEAAALRLDGLCVSRGRPVLRDVSLEIPANAITALLGPNGAGKSSLVLAVGGVLRPTAGRVLVGEQARDEVARQHEEHVDAEVSAREPHVPGPGVVQHHEEDCDRADAVERRDVLHAPAATSLTRAKLRLPTATTPSKPE